VPLSIKSERAKSVRTALTAIFFLQGALGTVMIPRVPELIEQIDVNFTAWGAILGFSGLGALVGLMFANRYIVRFGSRRVLEVSAVASALLLVSLPFITNAWIFFIVQAAMAFTGSCFNIALNMQAVVLQKMLNRTIIGKFHAGWSIGAASSAALSAVLATFLPMWLHFLLIPGAAAIILYFAATRTLTAEEIGKSSERKPEKKSPFWKAPSQLWLLSAGLFAGVFPEAAIMDWSAVFGKKVLDLDAGLSAIPYTLFVGAMIISRLSIGRLTRNRHVGIVSFWGGLLGSVAMGAGALLGPVLSDIDPILGLAATATLWFVAGLGIGPMSPSFMSAAGYVKGLTTAQALARMSLISSVLFMGGKFVMGAIAQDVNLVAAFMLPTALACIAGLIAGAMAKRAEAEQATIEDAFPITGPIGIIAQDK
jgi:MFS family permease